MKGEKIRFAIVGLGHIGKRHAGILSVIPEAELVALIDVLPIPEADQARYQVPCFSSLDSFFQSGLEADVISVTVPNGLHAEIACRCLDAGFHVVVEKPLAISSGDAEGILSCARRNQKNVFAVMQNRYSSPARWLKQLIDEEKLGQIYTVQVNCYWNRDERYYTPGSWHGSMELDGGVLFTQFSHFIDMLYWLMGDIHNIDARFVAHRNHHLTDFEDGGFVRFDFGNGAVGLFNFSTAVWGRNMESSLTIIAENGSVKIGGQYMESVEFCHIRNYLMPEELRSHPAGTSDNHRHFFENVIDVLKGRSIATVLPEDGVRVVNIIERIYASAVRPSRRSASDPSNTQ